ncbi:hypothetical protein [Cryptosporangium aurantiacum]|uniref:Uncharacterized protein n=1 Tax=Cryptosporangium aurantiacum TaxID=134849 RepID=A0A1M7RD08_9ACTN|nr:hypothetical protein [Cryptosporangium aurantiacum]SHN44187.1 hypothetical protein SAMN05443668_110106 [Cryptosporangium aurantiacum]
MTSPAANEPPPPSEAAAPTDVAEPDQAPAQGEPAAVGAAPWTRGAAAFPPAYAPTGPFPGDFQPVGRLPSFDSPGYGYGYATPPTWHSAFEGPKAWPVAVFTVFFGIFGAISAARRSSDARALGLPVGRYWGVFAGALVGSFAMWTLVLGLVIAVLVPVYLESATVMTTSRLEQQLKSSSSPGLAVTDAACVEEAVDTSGTGTYQCLITFTDGDSLPYRITVSDDGTWATSAAD